MASNLYEELKEVLQEFKDFLEENVPTIKPVVAQLIELVPQLGELIDLLIGLMNDLKTEIENLDVSAIQDLDKVSEFSDQVVGFLDQAKKLLPEQAGTIEDVRDVAEVVGSLPTIDQVKTEILSLIDAIVAQLNNLKP